MPPAKSWNCACKISRTWKILENEFGPGKSSKSKYKVLESPGNCSAVMKMQTPKCVHTHTTILCLNSFFAIFSQRVTVTNICSSMDAAIVLDG